MDEKDLPSSSDESDADFVPKEEEENSDSRSEVSDCETSEDENNTKKTRKRKKRSKTGCKKAKTDKSEDEEDNEVVEEKQKTDIDALWADFKKDVNNLETKKTAESSNAETESLNGKSSEGQVQTNSLDNKLNKGGFGFPNKSRGCGLSSVLSQIGKKNKMSTLQKSQLDWKKFKQSEGIEEEIKMYNRGKDGYLEKQDFLQRTDLRQFEIEKDLRTSRRKF